MLDYFNVYYLSLQRKGSYFSVDLPVTIISLSTLLFIHVNNTIQFLDIEEKNLQILYTVSVGET